MSSTSLPPPPAPRSRRPTPPSETTTPLPSPSAQCPSSVGNPLLHPGTAFSTAADLLRNVSVLAVVAASRGFLTHLTDTELLGRHRIWSAVTVRPTGTPLVTFANHNSTLDDPLLMSLIVPDEALVDSRISRWSWCASDVCFKREEIHPLFFLFKTTPVDRAASIHQPNLRWTADMLARGEWVNVFPEGNVVQNQNYRIKRLKWGIAKAIVESSKQGKIPILLPWVHRGMEDVIPLKNPYLPLPGKKVKVLIGEPLPIQKTIQAGEKLLKNNPGWGNPFPPPEELLYQQIMDDMAESLEKHQEELEQVWE